MNNTLRQLEKNLRTFAKRCKGISYNKTLLFTFLFTGLTGYVLKAAPSDAEETLQKDVNATILDLRQSFKRTKEQNEKFLENANLEMAQLMMQGEQVIKSNWTSWQFGFGGMFNTQLSRYRGFGGKSDDIKYSRTNDLTKYVFDANQNHWNATTLDIKKNKEPDSKSIDPADIHQGYEPNTVTKLDRVKLLDDVNFNVAVTAPPAGYYGFDRQMVAPRGYNAITNYEIETNMATRNDHRSDQGGTFSIAANANANANANTISVSLPSVTTIGAVSTPSVSAVAYVERHVNDGAAIPTWDWVTNLATNNRKNSNSTGTIYVDGLNNSRWTHNEARKLGAYFDDSNTTHTVGNVSITTTSATGVHVASGNSTITTGTITSNTPTLGVQMSGTGGITTGGINLAGQSIGVNQTAGSAHVNGTLTVNNGGIGVVKTAGDTTVNSVAVMSGGMGLSQAAGNTNMPSLIVEGNGVGAHLNGGNLYLNSTHVNSNYSTSGAIGVIQSAGNLSLGTVMTVEDKSIGISHSGGTMTNGTATINLRGASKAIVTSAGLTNYATIASNNSYGNKVGIQGTGTGAITNRRDISLINGKLYGISSTGAVDNNSDITLTSAYNNSAGIHGNGVTHTAGNISLTGVAGEDGLHGIYSTGTAAVSGGNITVTGRHNNNGVSATGNASVSNATVTVTGNDHNNGVRSTGGNVDINLGGKVVVGNGWNNDGIQTAGGNATVTQGTVEVTGTYNNAVHVTGTGTAKLDRGTIKVSGSYSNGMHAPSGNVTTTGGSITIGGGAYNNGINLTNSGGTNSIDGTAFNINSSNNIGIRVAEYGAGTTVKNNHFYIGSSGNPVNYSVGVYVAPGKEITGVNSNSSTSYGTHNTGILVSSNSSLDGKASTIKYGTHTINGTYSNGIELDTKEDTTIDTVIFNVLGQHSTGLVAGRHWNQHDPMNDLVVKGSIFNVSGGNNNSTSGIYLDNVKKTKIDPTTYMYVANASTGIELINSGSATREIEFGRGNVSMHLGRNHSTSFNDGGGNIGVNIISDKSVNGGTVGFVNQTIAAQKQVKIHGFADIYAESDDNTLFNNQGYADKLEITNGDKMYPTPVAGNGIIKIGRSRLYQGQPREGGNNKNTIFANLGYVKDTASKIDLNHIEIDGNNNKVAFFNTTLTGSSHGQASPTLSYTRLGKIGWFAGSVALQGIVGYSNGNDLVTSSNNVGVYAISGQRKEINPQVNIGHHTQTTLPDLTISDINIGFSRHSVNGTLVYAAKGTAVSVENNTAATTGAGVSGMRVRNTITDGTYMPDAATHIWGYDTPYSQTSLSTTLMRADGVWINEEYDGSGNLTGGHRLLVNNGDTFLYKPSEIKVKSNVDMTSRKGTAYLATNGGRVTVAEPGTPKHTRASGYESIIAYAQGIHAKSRDDSADDIFPIVNDDTYKQKGSRVTINGGITAADNSIIGREQANYSLPERVNTYKNIAAYASDNGDILIQKSAVNPTTNGVEEASNAFGGTDKSLIYGMAAYATGEGSNVVYSDKSGKEAAATVVTGEHGALFAERGGYIEFSGDIVHQNNAQDQITQNTAGHVQGTRRGRGVIPGTPNDHTNLPVFYARRTADTVNEGKTAIVFNRTTNIDMYDGILLAGNNYYHGPGAGNWDFNKGYSDYYKGKTAAAGEANEYNAAKYRGMENVTVKILQTYDGVNGVDLGLINQAKEELNWDSTRDGSGTAGGTNYLSGVGKYAGEMVIENPANPAETDRSVSGNSGFKSTLINSKLKITEDVNLENRYVNQYISHDKKTDPFNNIVMEGVLVTNDQKTISGDVATSYRAGQGLNMANSLYRYDDSELILNPATATYRRSKNDEAGYNNLGKVNVWGGTARGNVQITGINVANATVNNGNDDASKKGEVTIDHGYGIAGSDNSVIRNKKDSKITVTGKYDPKGQDPTNGYISEARTRLGYAKETEATGENYGIVGLSTNNARDHRNYGSGRYGENAIAIENIEGKIKVDGDLAVGIYAANKKYDDGTDGADQNRVTI